MKWCACSKSTPDSRRLYRYLFSTLLTLLLAGPCLAEEKAWKADVFTAWIGKYPTSTVNGKDVNILATAPLKQVIEQTVPLKERQLLRTYGVETPIKLSGNFLLIQQCKPHDCPSEMATVVVDLSRKRVWVGLFARKDGSVSTRWYGNVDDYAVLPAEIREEFVARHGE